MDLYRTKMRHRASLLPGDTISCGSAMSLYVSLSFSLQPTAM